MNRCKNGKHRTIDFKLPLFVVKVMMVESLMKTLILVDRSVQVQAVMNYVSSVHQKMVFSVHA